MTGAPDLLASRVLDLRGLEAPTLRVYPVADHIADKLCATQARYGAGGELRSSRVRDLVDMVVLACSQDVDGSALITAVRGEWAHRGLAGVPMFEPPAEWTRLYPPEARKAPAVAGFTRFDEAVALVRSFLAPALDGTAAGRRWSAAELRWQ